MEDAIKSLSEVSGLNPKNAQENYDLLRLMGAVLSIQALLEVVTNPEAKDTARVAAAKALGDLKEKPEHIAERLKSAPFSGLTVEDMQDIVRRMKDGGQDLRTLIAEKKAAKHSQQEE